MYHTTQEGIGREDEASTGYLATVDQSNPADGGPIVGDGRLDEQILDQAFDDRQVRGLIQQADHGVGVEATVALRPGRPHRRPLAAVEHAELDAADVRGQAHQPAEGVDLADHLALGDAAHGGVATHPADGSPLHRDQDGRQTHPRRRGSRFGAGVPAPYHNDLRLRPHREYHSGKP